MHRDLDLQSVRKYLLAKGSILCVIFELRVGHLKVEPF